MTTSADETASANVPAWEHAPCALVEVDVHGIVSAANALFFDRTGHRPDQVIGRLRWPELLTAGSRVFFEAQLAPILTLNGAVHEVMLDLLAADRGRLPVLMNAQARIGADGRPDGLRIALMSVPDRREYENELRRARAAAELANEVNIRSRQRLELLARATAALAGEADADTAISALTQVLVEQLADWCLVYFADPRLPLDQAPWTARHVDPARQGELELLAPALPGSLTRGSVLGPVLAGSGPVLIEQISDHHLVEAVDSAEVRDRLRGLDVGSALLVPARARGARVAVLILIRSRSRAPFTTEDLDDLTDLAARAGMATDNMRRYAREHEYSLALQQALLTTPPKLDGVEIVSRYLPAAVGAEVGGDWYDAFLQADGDLLVAIGDVVGHDIHAAASMGHLRGIIRTIGHTLVGTPAEMMARADRSAVGLGVDVLATAVLARIEGRGSTAVTLRWTNAGHPPPLLISADGVARLLEFGADPLLGVLPDHRRHDHAVALQPGDTVLLYTDGLVERRDETLDVSLARLAARVANTQHLSLDQVCDMALGPPQASADDIALLAVRISATCG